MLSNGTGNRIMPPVFTNRFEITPSGAISGFLTWQKRFRPRLHQTPLLTGADLRCFAEPIRGKNHTKQTCVGLTRDLK
jgi:hypothetical protein